MRLHPTSTLTQSATATVLAVLVMLAMLFGGCATAPKLTRPPLAPPDDASWMMGAGNVRLYVAEVLPVGEPVGVIAFVQGPEIGSAPLYPRFSALARDAGFVTAVVHPRGTGYSDGLRGDLDDFALFLADQRQGLERLRKRFPTTPIFLFGHSAGGALALELAAHPPTPLAGVVLVNPTWRLIYSEGMGPTAFDYVAFGFNFVCRPTALTVDMNSQPSAVVDDDDRAEAEAMQRDPLVVRHFSMRFMAAQRAVMDRCLGNAAASTAPLLVVQGAHDVLVDPAGNDEILAAAATTDKTHLIAPDGGHGSSAVETVADTVLQWLQAHGPAPSPSPSPSTSASPP